MHSSGTQTHVPQAHNAKRESSARVTTDGRNKEQGKAEGANRSRWPHSSVVPVPALTPADQQSPLTLPSAQAGISRIRSLQRANSRSWGPPPRHRGPKPGKGPIAGSESCKRSNCLPFQNLGSSLEGVGRGEHKGAMAPYCTGLPYCKDRPREAWEAESWSHRLPALSGLIFTLLGDGAHAGLVAQPFLPSTTPTHSDISSLTCFLKKI